MQNDIWAARRSCIASDCVVGDCATEAIAAAFKVEPEQVLTVDVRLDVPELPDETAFDKDASGAIPDWSAVVAGEQD
jgi:hypothetical protein